MKVVDLTNSVEQEPEGSSPHSQQPATGPCPELAESNAHPEANLSKMHSDPILPSTPWSSEWSLSFGLSHQNLVQLLSPIPCVPHDLPTSFALLYLPNNIW
jgi:hypothetical protein